MPKSPTRRIVAGTILSVVALFLVVLAFNAWLGWPNSLLTLGATLVVAWFIGAAIGGKISRSSWGVIAASILVVGLAVGSIAWGVPWQVGVTSVQTDKVNFIYQARFTYRGSASNLPIDNVYVSFPGPNVDNHDEQLSQKLTLTLFWQDTDNIIHPEIFMRGDGLIFQIFEYHGVRKENMKVLDVGIQLTEYGPKLFYNVDRLYPGEGIWSNDNVTAPAELADRVTLKEIGENHMTRAYYDHLPVKVNFIDLSFWAEIKKKIDDTYVPIETFSRTYDNGPPAWYKLYLS